MASNPPLKRARQDVKIHPAQLEFLQSPALFRGFVGGRGSGKSFSGTLDMLFRAKPGRTYLVASPTAIMMGDTTLPMFRAKAQELGLWGGIKVTPYPNVTLANGATIRFRTAEDPDKLRGPNLSGAWLDEASLMDEAAYTITIASLREAGEQGWLSATFTPNGPLHWTKQAFASGKPNTACIRARTGDNPFNPPTFEAKLQEQYGDTLFARQELGGEFVQLEGSEFPAPWFERPDFWFEEWPDHLLLKVIALDPSKGTDGHGVDDQAHTMIGLNEEGGRLVIYVDADLRREGVFDMCRRTVTLCKAFDAVGGRTMDSVVLEDNATMGLFHPAIQQACDEARYLMPWITRPSMGRKEDRIRRDVGPYLSRGQIRVRRTAGGKKLVDQLQSFPFAEKDDAMDSLATGLRRAAELLAGNR